MLNNVLTSLWRIPYERQLEFKNVLVEKALRKVKNILEKEKCLRPDVLPLVKKMEGDHEGLMCSLERTRPAPSIFEYRNKDTVTVGRGIDGNLLTVGITVGRTSAAAVIVNVDYVLNFCRIHKETAKLFQEFIRNSNHSISTSEDTGQEFVHWLNMTMRSTTTGQYMVCVRFYTAGKSEEFIQGAKDELTDFFVNGPGRSVGITSLYIDQRVSHEDSQPNYQHLYGDTHVHEKVLGHTFRISPSAFFQTYTQGAEILYSTVDELAQITKDVTVLDVCCGTGTIGILSARKAKQVFGVDMVQEAVDDAMINAEINGIKNAEFVCNKADKSMRWYLQDKTDEDIVAVINPSRNGVSKKLVAWLRRNEAIKRLVYMSCKPFGNVTKNFVNLVQPAHEEFTGKPFTAVKAVPVDMFPQTEHVEVAILFQR